MGRTVAEMIPDGPAPIQVALGEYLLAFAAVESALSHLLVNLKSLDPADPSKYDKVALKAAEKKLACSEFSAGKLAREVDRLVRKALDPTSAPEANALDIWGDLKKRGHPVIKDRNALVHREMPSADQEPIDPAQTTLLLSDGNTEVRTLSATDVRDRAEPARRLQNDLWNFYSTFLQAKMASQGNL